MVYKSSMTQAGGGGGVSSINGDTTAAQLITGGTGINVNTSGGDTVITATGAGSGTVTTTGTPALNGIAIFSGSTSITSTSLVGDITTSGATATLATVNSNIGSFGSSNFIPTFTVNAKGILTAAGTTLISAPASSLTGTAIGSTVVTSSLTSVGTLTGGSTGAGFTVALSTSTLTGNIATTNMPVNQTYRQITFDLDGQGSAIAGSGTWYLASIPYAGTITGWNIVADKSGSIVIDVWKQNASVPTASSTITASSLPTLTSAQSAFSGSIAGWKSTVSVGDVFAFNVNSASTITKASLTIRVSAS